MDTKWSSQLPPSRELRGLPCNPSHGLSGTIRHISYFDVVLRAHREASMVAYDDQLGNL